MNDTANERMPRLGVLLGAESDREADEFEALAAETLALLVEPIEPSRTVRDHVFSHLPQQRPVAVDVPRHRTPVEPAQRPGLFRRTDRRRYTGDARSVLTALESTSDTTHASTTFLGAASITVVSSAAAKASVAIVDGLPQPPAGHAYQFWLIRGGKPRPAGVFVPNEDAPTEFRVAGRYRAHDVVAITLEPASGSRKPTTTPLFALES
jgi:hypothetical protein